MFITHTWKIRAAQFLTCFFTAGVVLTTLASRASAADEITYTGINSEIYGDDGHTGGQKGPFNLGFDFKFFDTNYAGENAKVNININGALTFGSYYTAYSNVGLASGGQNNSLFPFWDDITSYQENNSAILYSTLGTAPNRKFVVQWTNMYFYGTTIQMGTFQIILYEGSNNIQLQYRDLLGGSRALGDSATIGIKKDNSTYLQYSLNTASLTQGQAIRYTHNGDNNYTVNTSAAYDPIYLAPEGAPTSPVLVNPTDGTTGITTTPTFEWLPVEGATSYAVLISTVSSFASTVVNQSGISGTTYTHGSALNESTQYYWRVQAINSYGSSLSSTRTFTTSTANANPNTPTDLSSAKLVGGAQSESLSGATLTANLTDPDDDEQVRYRLQIATDEGFNSLVIDYRSPFGAEGTATYTFGENGGTYLVGNASTVLTPGNYYLRIRTEDDAAGSSSWNTASGVAFTLLADEEAPGFSNVEANPSTNAVTITWETDEPGSSQVEYGLVNEDYTLQTAETNTDTRVTEHSVLIENLKVCARYFFRVKSTDAASNSATSNQANFSTTGCDTGTTIVSGNEGVVSKDTGGSLSYTNGSTTVALTIPSGFSAKSATFQLNRLSTENLPAPPAGKNLAQGNIYDLLAIDEDDEVIEEFDGPITFVIEYGEELEEEFEEETLDVYRYQDGEWTPLDCVLDMGANTLTCTLEHFSSYGVFGQNNSENSGGGGGNGGNPNSTSSSKPEVAMCTSFNPVSAPDLFQIDTTSPESALLHFSPVGGTTDGYIVEYGTTPLANEHAVKFEWKDEGGAVPYEIFSLNQQNATWYFRVQAYSGCAVGPWSPTMSVFVKS